MTEEHLAALIREVGLGHIEEKLPSAARPSLRLHLHPADEDAVPLHWQLSGRGYFYIPTQALAERNFNAVWVDMQCA